MSDFQFSPRWTQFELPAEVVVLLEERDRQLEDYLSNLTLTGGSSGTGSIVLNKVWSTTGTLTVPDGTVAATLTPIDIPADLDPSKEYRAVLQSTVQGYTSGSDPDGRGVFFIANHNYRSVGDPVYAGLPGRRLAVSDQDLSLPFISRTGGTVPLLDRITVEPGDSLDIRTAATNQSGFVYSASDIYPLSIEIFSMITVYQLDADMV